MLSSRFLLTAAHCKILPKRHYAQLANGATFEISSVISSNVSFDLAIVKVNQKITSPKAILGTVDPTNRMITAVGWGATNTNNFSTTMQLRWLNLTLFNQVECELKFQPHINRRFHLCASGSDTQGMCFGDSGSPGVQEQQQQTMVTIGLASFVWNGCAAGSHNPDVFVRIDTARSFIDAHVRGHSWTTSHGIHHDLPIMAQMVWVFFILLRMW